MIKISIIGAGTGTFSINLIKDICLAEHLSGSLISLMDINAERLDAVFQFCKRYSNEVGANLQIVKTQDRLESMRNADFVINTALVGGYQRLFDGWQIAKKWGYRFGGSFHVMHDEAFWINFYQLRLMEEIYVSMQEVCPEAWYILVANPVMAGITYLKRKYPTGRIVGMCHGYGGVFRMCELMGLEKSGVTFQAPGINHFVWLNSFLYRGQDAFPLIDQWIDEQSKSHFDSCKASDDFGPKAIDLYKKYALMPIGDTCTPGGGSWGYWYHVDEETQKRWKEDPDAWYDDNFANNFAHVDAIKRVAYDGNIRVSEYFSIIASDEPMVPLIDALASDVPQVVIVNILNTHGFVQGIPNDFEVEIPAYVSKRGIQGIETVPLPKEILCHAMRDRVASVEMELLAFTTGNKEYLVQLLLMDPFTKTKEQAEGLLEEILNIDYLHEMKVYFEVSTM